ncbi:MAG: NosD domain-containing protein [Candidatus Woesearchaeota archaeon]
MRYLIILLGLIVAGCVGVNPEAHISGMTEIEGDVSGPYALEYGKVGDSYDPIGHVIYEEHNYTQGKLGSWNTSGVEDGGYYVKLESGGASDYFFVEVDNLYISSPEDDTWMPPDDFVVIKGTARGNFSDYIVRYRHGMNWSDEGVRLKDDGKSEVVDDTLAVLNTTVLDSYGEYEIELRSSGNQTDSVFVNYLEPDEYEPDNSFNDSKVLVGTQERTLFPEGDEDYIRLEVEKGTYILKLEGAYLTPDIFDADYRSVPGKTQYTGDVQRTVFEVNSSPYYIRVSSYYDATSYEISLEEFVDNDNDGSPATVDCDDNNSKLVAPYSGLRIDSDITFCPGKYEIDSPMIVEENVSLLCNKTRIIGDGFELRDDVSIKGCIIEDAYTGLTGRGVEINVSDSVFDSCSRGMNIYESDCSIDNVTFADSRFSSYDSKVRMVDSVGDSRIYLSDSILDLHDSNFSSFDYNDAIYGYYSKLNISNVEISGYHFGIYLYRSDHGVVQNVTINDCLQGVNLHSSSYNNFTDNRIFNSGKGLHLRAGSVGNNLERFEFRNTNYTVYNEQEESIFMKDTAWGTDDVQEHIYDHHDNESFGYVNMSLLCVDEVNYWLNEDFALCKGVYELESDIVIDSDVMLDCRGSALSGGDIVLSHDGAQVKNCNASFRVSDSENVRFTSNVMKGRFEFLMNSYFNGNKGNITIVDSYNNSFVSNDFSVYLVDSYSNRFFSNTIDAVDERGYMNSYIGNEIFELAFIDTERFLVEQNVFDSEMQVNGGRAKFSQLVRNNTFKGDIAIRNTAPIPLKAPGNSFNGDVESVLIDENDDESYGEIIYDGSIFINETNDANNTNKTDDVNQTNKCIDSDGEDYYTKGRLIYKNEEYEDKCIDNGTLLEQFCVNGDVKGEVEYECDCLDGACVEKCKDSDGFNYSEKGHVMYENETYTDYCVNETSLVEYYCDKEVKEDEKSCNCVDGACSETCSDGIQNQDEEAVDCGGVCEPCLSFMIPSVSGVENVTVPVYIESNVNANVTYLISFGDVLEPVGNHTVFDGVLKKEVHVNKSGVIDYIDFKVKRCVSRVLELDIESSYESSVKDGSFTCTGGVDETGVTSFGQAEVNERRMQSSRDNPGVAATSDFSYTPIVSFLIVFLVAALVLGIVFEYSHTSPELEDYLQENHMKGHDMSVLKQKAIEQGWNPGLVEGASSKVFRKNHKYMKKYAEALYERGYTKEQVGEILRKFPSDLVRRL